MESRFSVVNVFIIYVLSGRLRVHLLHLTHLLVEILIYLHVLSMLLGNMVSLLNLFLLNHFLSLDTQNVFFKCLPLNLQLPLFDNSFSTPCSSILEILYLFFFLLNPV